jgi:archaellum biogenesis ATPase FlaH
MIDDKVMWMSKISFENVIMIKSFQIWLKNNYENDMEKMMCYYKTMWSYNYFTMINDF